MSKIKLLLSYDGTDFGGWQKQTSGKPTVQGCLEAALKQIFNQEVKTTGSGRTDAGVHALGQVVHFQVDKNLSQYNLLRALNSLTPKDMVIKNIWQTPDDFHAIASAEGKTYKYLIHNSPTPTATRHRFTTWVRDELDLTYLNEASQLFLGEHDFKSFQTRGTEVKSTIRHIHEAKWQKIDPKTVEFTISGNGFLKQMVRNIVGLLLDMHLKRSQLSEITEIISKKQRSAAGSTAPPEGLYLYRVHYPQYLDNKCRQL